MGGTRALPTTPVWTERARCDGLPLSWGLICAFQVQKTFSKIKNQDNGTPSHHRPSSLFTEGCRAVAFVLAEHAPSCLCLLYTSDAADEDSSV